MSDGEQRSVHCVPLLHVFAFTKAEYYSFVKYDYVLYSYK